MLQKQKKLLIAGNWKMTPATLQEARKKAIAFRAISKKYHKVSKSPISIRVLICPPAPFIPELVAQFKGSQAHVGAQDVSQYDGGSKTAEIASTMIKTVGSTYSIVGHSERRAAGDTDEIVSVKLGQVLRTGMDAILCIGESVRDQEGGYLDEIKRQLKESLERMSNNDFSNIVIAYEPVWAIGRTDNVALSGHELHQMVIYIRKVLRDFYNDTIASSVKILYGGSVTPENAGDIIWNGEVDGLLIGRASFEPESYEAICTAIITPTLQATRLEERQMISDIKRDLQTLKNASSGIAASNSMGLDDESEPVVRKKPVATKKAKPNKSTSKSAKKASGASSKAKSKKKAKAPAKKKQTKKANAGRSKPKTKNKAKNKATTKSKNRSQKNKKR